MILVYLSISWVVGIYLASRLSLPLVLWGAFALPALSVIWLWKVERRVRLAGWCALFLCLGAMRYAIALPRFVMPQERQL